MESKLYGKFEAFQKICTDSSEIRKGSLKFCALEEIAQTHAKKKEQKRENMTERNRAESDQQKETDENRKLRMGWRVGNLC